MATPHIRQPAAIYAAGLCVPCAPAVDHRACQWAGVRLVRRGNTARAEWPTPFLGLVGFVLHAWRLRYVRFYHRGAAQVSQRCLLGLLSLLPLWRAAWSKRVHRSKRVHLRGLLGSHGAPQDVDLRTRVRLPRVLAVLQDVPDVSRADPVADTISVPARQLHARLKWRRCFANAYSEVNLR